MRSPTTWETVPGQNRGLALPEPFSSFDQSSILVLILLVFLSQIPCGTCHASAFTLSKFYSNLIVCLINIQGKFISRRFRIYIEHRGQRPPAHCQQKSMIPQMIIRIGNAHVTESILVKSCTHRSINPLKLLISIIRKNTGRSIARNWINIRKPSLSSGSIPMERFLPYKS